MVDRLRDKVAIVSGAGTVGEGWGNGKATAVLFAREGAKVVCADINPAAAEETAAIISGEGGEATVVQVDVTDSAQVKAMID
ncbi:MAG: SDR family oxidoreductase, partial [Alphaproteobacteria bacterium]|nr:SDR family oxidoreductase [Alphaproteobacteria bacterium]